MGILVNLVNNIMMQPRIVIVGAGAAGIACGTKLLESGFTDIKILEAENRIGGRIHTVCFNNSNIDLGAQWCHGEENNIVYEKVNKLNLLQTSRCTYKDNVFYDSSGNLVDKEITDLLFGIATGITYDYEEMKVSKSCFGNYFIKRYIESVKREFGANKSCLEIANTFVGWFHKLILCYDAPPSWFEMSSSGLTQYKDCEGDPLLNWKNAGYRIFLDVLMQSSKSLNSVENTINFNKEVSRILWKNQNSSDVVIHCSDGSTYNADHVVVTTSVGVLKDQHRKMFVPELPFYKVNAIEAQGFGIVNKIFLKFPHTWWHNEDTSFCFLWKEDDRMNILNEFPFDPIEKGRSWLEDISGFFVVDSDPTVLLGWLVGELTQKVEQLSNEMLQKGCVYLLNKFLGDRYDIPEPTSFICSRWYCNPHFRGSYSFKSTEADRRNTSNNDLMEPLLGEGNKPTVLFAGEATHPYFFSTVHGAVETGYREADRIISINRSNLQKNGTRIVSKY